MHRGKLALARLLDATGVHEALLAGQARFGSPHLRAVNYHDVTPARAADFERQLRFFRERYTPMGKEDVLALAEGRWRSARPGIVVSFDDGLRSHAEICAPLLERYEIPGWFMVPAGFVSTPPAEQAAFAAAHRITAESPPAPDGRVALSWDEVRQLDKRHVVGCHGFQHERLSAALSDAELEREIALAKRTLEGELGHEVDVFAWIGGEEPSYSSSAARRIREAGFRLSFMTNHAPFRTGDSALHIQRSNVEAHFPMSVVRLHVSGVMDLLYTSKRRRVNRLTS
jgi:peptidoglycan/xylan/chitin deacetylase (PgdA/CDA1 family)